MIAHPELQWLFGDLLDRRLAFEIDHPGVQWSRLVRLLHSDQKAINEWARHIAAFRTTLTNPEDAKLKAASDLETSVDDFDGELLDAMAEWLTPAQLKPFGFDSFTLLVPPAQPRTPMPDLTAVRASHAVAIEVKNLRAHECVEAVMPEMFYDQKLKGLDVSGIRLAVRRSFRGTLNDDEKGQLRRVIAKISSYALNAIHREQLSGRAEAVFQVIPGDGDAIGLDYIGMEDLERDLDAYKGLLNKIADNTRKALRQLSAPAAQSCGARVVAMRWDIPFASMPFPASLSDAVLRVFEEQRSAAGVSADLHVFTDHSWVLASTL